MVPLASTIRPIRSGRSSRTRPRTGRVSGAALAALFAVALTACAPDPVAEQYLSGDDKGYISADGAYAEIAPEDRGDPIVFGGVTEDGEEFRSADIAGDVTVVNFWYAGCAPCRAEAKDLESVWQENKDEDVSFVGINIYDQADTAKAFAETYGVTYPSLIDVDSGEAKLAFASDAPLQGTPSTLVLDTQGRVAARIVGPLDGPSILSTLVKDALAEGA